MINRSHQWLRTRRSRKQATRRYPGEADAAPLIWWLNTTKQKSVTRNIAQIIVAINEAAADVEENEASISTVNQRLRHFQMFPRFGMYFAPGRGWATHWQVRNPEAIAELPKQLLSWPVFDQTYSEADAIHDVISLAKRDLIGRICSCVCGTWFFVRVRRKKYCSKRCQESAYKKSPDFKAERRSYMKRYRKLKESGFVK